MKNSINLSDQMSLSGRAYQSFIADKPNKTSKHSQNKYQNNQEKGITPWIGKQKKQIQLTNRQKQIKHQFLSKINFKSKKPLHMYQTISSKKNIQQQNSSTIQITQQRQQNIVIFPKCSSTRNPQPNINTFNNQQQQIFMPTKNKLKQRQIKKSAIISLDLDIKDNQPISPQKILNITKSKNLNPFQMTQKKKQLMKYKIKHHHRLSIFYQKQRSQSLQNYLKYITENPKRSVETKRSKVIRNKKKFEENKSVDLSNIVCQGQMIHSVRQHKRFKFRKSQNREYDKTLFLF